MRVLHKASLVVLLNDFSSKEPIRTASILCNGRHAPYSIKRSGHYAFANLQPNKYNIKIICPGYKNMSFSENLRENETKLVTLNLSYAVNNPKIVNLCRFQVTSKQDGKIIKNKKLTLKLKNKLNFIKLIKNIEPNSYNVFLNMEMNKFLMVQKFQYIKREKTYEMLFTGYDNDNKCYVLENPFDEKIEKGGFFRPIWELETDSKGRVIIPIIDFFMKDESVRFELQCEDLKTKRTIKINMPVDDEKVSYADFDFADPDETFAEDEFTDEDWVDEEEELTNEEADETANDEDIGEDTTDDELIDEDEESNKDESVDDTDDEEPAEGASDDDITDDEGINAENESDPLDNETDDNEPADDETESDEEPNVEESTDQENVINNDELDENETIGEEE